MKTDHEIRQMFKNMDLETEEKRSRFNFSFSYKAEPSSDIVTQIRLDSKTEEIEEDRNAQLERDF